MITSASCGGMSAISQASSREGTMPWRMKHCSSDQHCAEIAVLCMTPTCMCSNKTNMDRLSQAGRLPLSSPKSTPAIDDNVKRKEPRRTSPSLRPCTLAAAQKGPPAPASRPRPSTRAFAPSLIQADFERTSSSLRNSGSTLVSPARVLFLKPSILLVDEQILLHSSPFYPLADLPSHPSLVRFLHPSFT